jgi:hypothetical protein
MNSNETVKVSSRSGKTVHLGYSVGGPFFAAMCGQRGKFGKSYAPAINCEKCLAAHGQGSAALAAARQR